MTTQTTGTAPLIERVRNQINYLDAVVEYDVRDNPELRQGIADLRSLLNDAFAGPGIWIEREQARETIAKAYWTHGDGDLPTWDELDEMAPETKHSCYAVADSIIAALAGGEQP